MRDQKQFKQVLLGMYFVPNAIQTSVSLRVFCTRDSTNDDRSLMILHSFDFERAGFQRSCSQAAVRRGVEPVELLCLALDPARPLLRL